MNKITCICLGVRDMARSVAFYRDRLGFKTDCVEDSPRVCFFDTPGDFSNIEEQEDCFHPDTGELMLGDIMISVEHVFAQAKEYGHSVRRELAFLVAHSMLHLMGYDHMEEEERRLMEERQEAILERIGITRDSVD